MNINYAVTAAVERVGAEPTTTSKFKYRSGCRP